MEYTLYINQKAALEWDLNPQEALAFSYLINLPPCTSGTWMRQCPVDPTYRWMASAKLCAELPLVVRSVSMARKIMIKLEQLELIERMTHGNKSYFRMTDKGLEWKSGTLTEAPKPTKPRVPKSEHPSKEVPISEHPKGVEVPISEHPRVPISEHQSDIPLLSDKPISSDKPEPPKKSPPVWLKYEEQLEKVGHDPIRLMRHRAQFCQWHEEGVTEQELGLAIEHSRKSLASQGDTKPPAVRYIALVLATNRKEAPSVSAGPAPETTDEQAERIAREMGADQDAPEAIDGNLAESQQ